MYCSSMRSQLSGCHDHIRYMYMYSSKILNNGKQIILLKDKTKLTKMFV